MNAKYAMNSVRSWEKYRTNGAGAGRYTTTAASVLQARRTLSKPKPLFTVCPDRIAWMPGTTKAGLATRAAKSVTTKTMNPTNARVHKTERTDRPPDGGGGGR